MHERILILDFGSQYTQLIGRRVREWKVFSQILPYQAAPSLDDSIKGVILSGSPSSVRDEQAPNIDLDQYLGKVPVLAICYGAQLITQQKGGRVEASDSREFGKAVLEEVDSNDPLFHGIEEQTQVWMSHGDTMESLGASFQVIARTNDIPVAAFRTTFDKNPVYGLQFHPEVTHTLQGSEILRNFLFRVAGCKGDWTPEAFIDETVSEIRERVGTSEVFMALSGGVDSTVAATLLDRAIGDRLHCHFIDNGLLRKHEFEEVLDNYEALGLNVTGIEARERFWDALEGVRDPERKRKIIGGLFIEIFEEEAEKLPDIDFLGQGTIYPDVIESISVHGPSATIKSHHNVGGLPDELKLEVVEPLRMLFKDEVRKVGIALGLPEEMVYRHPFPGPGLAIRILGAVTPDKVKLLQEADHIYIQHLKEYGAYRNVWQAGAILLPVHSVGVMGDERTYEQVVALRAVQSVDGMTAEWCRLPYDLLGKISTEIINKVQGINRVVYDISTKPPSTIEWE